MKKSELLDKIQENWMVINETQTDIAHLKRMVFPKPQYVTMVRCPNCSQQQTLSTQRGAELPSKYKCDNCGCDVIPVRYINP